MSDANKTNVDGATFRAEIDDKLLDSVAAEPITANTKELYKALSMVAREQLARRWVQTQVDDRNNKSRRIYYMSMEFLIGRTLNNALSALDLRDKADAAFSTAGGPSLTGGARTVCATTQVPALDGFTRSRHWWRRHTVSRTTWAWASITTLY